MKFCLRNRQIAKYLTKADEIKMEYRDYKSIPDLFENYPDIPVIVQIKWQEEVDWEELELYKRMKPNCLICCISTLEQAQICKDLDIKFYYGYPISTYHELNNWLKLGVCYVRLDAPLFFDLPNVVKITKKVPIRAVANVANEIKWPDDNGLYGTWIRPENVKDYERYISTIEFEDCDNRKEQALFRIYAEQHEWPGDIDMLITNYTFGGVNRMLPPEFGEKRMTCRHRCQQNKCNYCYWVAKLADPEKLKEYKEQIIDNKDTGEKEQI